MIREREMFKGLAGSSHAVMTGSMTIFPPHLITGQENYLYPNVGFALAVLIAELPQVTNCLKLEKDKDS